HLADGALVLVQLELAGGAIDDGVHDDLPCSSPCSQSKALPALRNATIRKEAVHASAMKPNIHRRLLAATRSYLAGFGETVPEGFLRGAAGAMEERPLSARPLPCLRHLHRISSTAAEENSEIVRLLAENRYA